MRLVLVAIVACSSAAPPSELPHRPREVAIDASEPDAPIVRTAFSLEVLGLEPLGDPLPLEGIRTAQRLTRELQDAARAYTKIRMKSARHDLLDEKLLINCMDEALTCMDKVAYDVGAERIIYGHLAMTGSTMRADLKLLVAETGYNVAWSIEDAKIDEASLRTIAREAMTSLLSRSP